MIDDMWERVFVVAIGGMMPDPNLTKEDIVRIAEETADLAEEVYLNARGGNVGEVYISESR